LKTSVLFRTPPMTFDDHADGLAGNSELVAKHLHRDIAGEVTFEDLNVPRGDSTSPGKSLFHLLE